MVPEVGFTDPQSDPSNVVLPAPLCPRTPVSVPLGNEKLTSRSAHTSEENLPNRLFKSRTDKLQYCSISTLLCSPDCCSRPFERVFVRLRRVSP